MTVGSELLTKSSILERDGWTRAAISKFLGAPDKEIPNPRFKSAANVKMWCLDSVKQVESSAEWASWVEKSSIRKMARLKVCDRKRRELTSWIGSLTVFDEDVLSKNVVQLRAEAIAHYNDRQESLSLLGRGDFLYSASVSSDGVFLDRITVNYLRHVGSCYESVLACMFGVVGKSDGYVLLRNRILDVIGNTWPVLAVEADRQRIV